MKCRPPDTQIAAHPAPQVVLSEAPLLLYVCDESKGSACAHCLRAVTPSQVSTPHTHTLRTAVCAKLAT